MSETIYCCSECDQTYTSKRSLAIHQRCHSNKYIKIKQELENKIFEYNQNPKLCLQCQNPIHYKKRNNKFCDSSCSASFTNLKRPPRSEESKQNTKNALSEYYIKNDFLITNKKICHCKKCNKEFIWQKTKGGSKLFCSEQCFLEHKHKKIKNLEIIKPPKKISFDSIIKRSIKYAKEEGLPFTLLSKCHCSHCQKIFLERSALKYCRDCRHLYSIHNRNQYKFTFNVYHYPELFNLDLLNEIGFYSPGGKAGKWNINGLSRDHKISVNESIKNGYDPFYIKHPLNCELMTHLENNQKKTRSSITYNELKYQVNLYESLK